MNIKKLARDLKNIGMPRPYGGRGLLYLYIAIFSICLLIPEKAKSQSAVEDNDLTASLITCWPGSEIYELCGHSAVRIKGEGIDSVWNFGLFDFNEPNFVYRFVKGETDYNVAGYPFRLFLPEYISSGRRVEEQVLNLTPAQVNKLRKLLQQHSLPPLNRYRYNYIKNNCSTQIADLLDETAGGKILYRDSVRNNTFREVMRAYHKNYPWYQFGIDVALGSGLEEEISQREELFVPVEFNRHARSAFLPDGTPLIRETNVIYEGTTDAVEGPTPWFAAPWFCAVIVLLITIGICFFDFRRNKISKWWYSLYFGIEGLAGCLVFFLVFISVHEATSPNILIFWLNPLQLIIPAFIWSKKMEQAVKAMMWINICAVGIMVLLIPFYLKGQGSQWGFLPLMLADLLMAATYIALNWRTSSKKKNSGKKKKKTKKKK